MRLGAVAPASVISLDVTLKVPDQAALTTFLAGLSNRTSPYFHDFLTPAQFGLSAPRPARSRRSRRRCAARA